MSRQNWRTPPSLFAQLSRDFGPFDLDAAADDENHLCAKYYTKETDGLRSPWLGRVFINVPFGEPAPWVDKARRELATNCSLVCMIGVANITAEWFHEAMKIGTLYAPDKRIAYWHPDEPPGSMDRDTCIIVMDRLQPGWRVEPYEVPALGVEIRRLHAEANGQATLFGAA